MSTRCQAFVEAKTSLAVVRENLACPLRIPSDAGLDATASHLEEYAELFNALSSPQLKPEPDGT